MAKHGSFVSHAKMETLELRTLLSSYPMSLGSTGTDQATDSAVDSAGNTICVGTFAGTVDFDPSSRVTKLTASGIYSTFVAKYSAAGSLLWARRLGGFTDVHDATESLWARSAKVEIDPSGNIWVLGNFSGARDFNPGSGVKTLTSVDDEDVYLCKLTSAGNYVWAGRMGGTGGDGGWDMAVSAAGVFVTGKFQHTVDFNPGSAVFNLTSNGSSDMFVCRFTLSCGFAWARRIGDNSPGASRPNDQWGVGIALDSSNNLYLAGGYQGITDFDPGAGKYTMGSIGQSENGFVMKMTSGGGFIWAKSVSTSNPTFIADLAIDTSANIYLTGGFTGKVDFDPSATQAMLTSAGGFDIFVAKLTKSGSYVSAKRIGGSGNDLALGIAYQSGSVNLTGMFSKTVDFNPSSGVANLVSAGKADMFACRLTSSSLTYSWAKRYGGTQDDCGWAVTPLGSSQLMILGFKSGTLDSELNVTGNSNALIDKLTQNGAQA